MVRWSFFVLAAAVLAGCGSSKQAATTTTTLRHAALPGHPPQPAPRKLVVKITAATHTPKVSTPWRYTVHATVHGKPVPATISVQVLYQGIQVADLGTFRSSSGVASGVFSWPPVSHAHLLIVSARATSKGRVGTDSYQVAGQ